jgi:hypothetical protein
MTRPETWNRPQEVDLMELVISVVLLIALAVGAELWGADSREGFTSVAKPARWFVTPGGHGDRPSPG